MASVMGICWGLVGPKSGNVEKVFVSKLFLKGQEGHEDAKAANNSPGRHRKSKIFVKNASWLYSELCFLL